jgi:hypothetical protein
LEKGTVADYSPSSSSYNLKSFNFVIVGTLIHQSKDDAFKYIEYLLKKNSQDTDINIIHVFGEY